MVIKHLLMFTTCNVGDMDQFLQHKCVANMNRCLIHKGDANKVLLGWEVPKIGIAMAKYLNFL